MTPPALSDDTLLLADEPTLALVRLSAIITAGTDEQIRTAFAASTSVPVGWVEELLLQIYLFAGFPRALNATREWRRLHPEALAPVDERSSDDWRVDGEKTCAAVYGRFYEPLRRNIRELHPLLDEWMVIEG
jgi:4-carboxymuconolactone decarboxylase